MRVLLAIFAALWLWRPVPAAGSAAAGTGRPPDAIIVSTAQQFVLEHFKRRPSEHFGIAFDIANIHPQPDPNFWAVIGGFMADSGGKKYRPHAFGVAMRVICAEHEKLSCWQLEKLVIDQTIILNN